MASANDDNEGGEEQAPRECMACRGSGSVVSNLGGTPKTVTCPWCRGTGKRIADIDAQSGWPESQAAGQHAVSAEGGGSGGAAGSTGEGAESGEGAQSGDAAALGEREDGGHTGGEDTGGAAA